MKLYLFTKISRQITKDNNYNFKIFYFIFINLYNKLKKF